MSEPRREAVAFVSVGSNIEPRRSIVAALEMLKGMVTVRASSVFYRTEPVGGRGQPAFVNGVWRVRSELEPMQLKNQVLAPIEARLGRVRTEDRFAPRVIDLDLVLYDNLRSEENGLILPHPDIVRPFVHGPIVELLDGAANEIEADLLAAIRTLLPAPSLPVSPGEPLDDLTAELRRLIA